MDPMPIRAFDLELVLSEMTRTEELKLHMGELTLDEVYIARAAVRAGARNAIRWPKHVDVMLDLIETEPRGLVEQHIGTVSDDQLLVAKAAFGWGARTIHQKLTERAIKEPA